MTTSILPTPSILILGHDRALVDTRKWVLEKAGYQLETLVPFTSAPELPVNPGEMATDLVLLCDSLSPETRQTLLNIAPARWPSAKLIVISPDRFHVEQKAGTIVFPSFEGPGKLVALIRQLLPSTPSPYPATSRPSP